MNPISGRELIVPHAVVLEERGLCLVHTLLQAGASLTQGIHQPLTKRVSARKGTSPAPHARAGGQLAVVTRHARSRRARTCGRKALVGPGAPQVRDS